MIKQQITDKYLWKKRILLIKKKQNDISNINKKIEANKFSINKFKIKILYFDNNFKSNIILIGLDGLIKIEQQSLDLEKIFKLISTMPMSDF